jgi:hypothetical protein
MSKRKMNNKWPKAPIIYKGRALRTKSDRITVDVKNFITTNDEMLKKVIKRNNLDSGSKNQIAHKCQKFIVNFLEYKYDKKTSNCPEFWQFPFETLQSEIGDCEDGAILMASLMIQSGIPAWRVKVAAGEVKAKPTAPTGGHAYCIYYADRAPTKKSWVIMDWCFFEDSHLKLKEKPLARNGGQHNAYKKIWFTFNNEYSWNQEEIEAPTRMAEVDTTKSNSTRLLENIADRVQKVIESK